jgi:hypothetical protein
VFPGELGQIFSQTNNNGGGSSLSNPNWGANKLDFFKISNFKVEYMYFI